MPQLLLLLLAVLLLSTLPDEQIMPPCLLDGLEPVYTDYDLLQMHRASQSITVHCLNLCRYVCDLYAIFDRSAIVNSYRPNRAVQNDAENSRGHESAKEA